MHSLPARTGRRSGIYPPLRSPNPLPGSRLLVVVLHFGEFRIDDVFGARLAAFAGRAFGTTLRGGRDRGEQRLARFLQRLGLGLDLGLVVALHRRLDVGDRSLGAADDVPADLVAIVLDRAASGMDQAVGLVARLHQLVELAVFLAVGLGVLDHALDLFVAQARTGLDLDLLFLAGLLV